MYLCSKECLRKSLTESKSDDELDGLDESELTTNSRHGSVSENTQPIRTFCFNIDDQHDDEVNQEEVKEIKSTCPLTTNSRHGSVSENTQPIRPFCFNIDDQHDDEVNQEEVKEIKSTCPLCYLSFPLNEIETHADVCAQEFDPVGTVYDDILELEIPCSEDEDESLKRDVWMVNDVQDNPVSTVTKIKEVVSNLHQGVDQAVTNRVSIRRRYAYEDYLSARQKLIQRKRFYQNGKFKVTFIGEPAVDDGGPRREFFSGTVLYLCMYVRAS